jgi:Flp pilus assembly protein TadB
MKFPSLIRLPQYKKFVYEPRYFDPVKDEITERTARIKQEVEADQRMEAAGTREQFRREMDQVFQRRLQNERSTNILQVVLVLLMVLIFVGYLFYGNAALYPGLVLLAAYIVFRIRTERSRHG